jgi:hypothetical protein
MKLSSKFILPFIIIGSIAMIQACSDDPAGPGADASEAVIHGSIAESETNEESQLQSNLTNVEGVTVTAARVTSDGSFQLISDTETETDASGNFTLHLDVETEQHLAIIAGTDSEQIMGFLSEKVENDNTYTIKPLDIESTVETEIFASLVASGESDLVSKSDIELVVTSNNAASIHGNSSAVSEMASSLAEAAEARAAFIAEMAEENSEAILNQATELKAEAQFQLEASLESATSAGQRDEAVEVFINSVTDAYVEAGLDVSSTAKKFEMWSRLIINRIDDISSEIKNEARSSASLLTAIAIDKAVQVEAEASGMSEATIQAIIDAGVQLKADIKESSGASAEIESAFEQYHDDVRTAMETDGSFEATAIIYIDADINASGGYKSIFYTALSGTLGSSLVIDAYSTFFSSVYASAENHLGEADETQISAIANMMILINLAV